MFQKQIARSKYLKMQFNSTEDDITLLIITNLKVDIFSNLFFKWVNYDLKTDLDMSQESTTCVKCLKLQFFYQVL